MQIYSNTNGPSLDSNVRDDYRRHPRYLVFWPVTVVASEADDSVVLHGETCEVSMGGVAVLADHEFSPKAPVTVHLTVPPLNEGGSETLIQLQCSMIYAYLDGRHKRFRLGFCLDSPTDESRVMLYDALSSRIPAPF